ncbi:MAG: PIG-L family deacetylase [Opitutaceae bacterium]|nr:PIG-L family deacetylase [Opitutaceae bacterium]
MKFSRADADVFTPGRTSPAQALKRTTHLCIAAHQDDIEIMAHAGIAACYDTPGRAFSGVVVTNGAGSPRQGRHAEYTDAELQAMRREEQRRAATIGRYAVQIQLGHPSADLKDADHPGVRADLAAILGASTPEVIYLHNPADKHDTHVAVLLRCLEAWRTLPRPRRPCQVLGCEVWRDLDWLVDSDKVALDAGQHADLAKKLLETFESQIGGGKRYDRATLGRRAAHATFHQARETDKLTAITWAMDLTPLFNDAQRSVLDFTLGHIEHLRADVAARLKQLGG